MNSPQAIFGFRWLIRDTFGQALASRIFWIMLGFSILVIVFCLGVSIEGGEKIRDGDFPLHPKTEKPLTGPTSDLGRLRLMFGMFNVPIARDRESEVHFLQVVLASWVAGTVGLLITLIWTAGFLPEFLQPANASVMLAKPVPRWLIILGKSLGVVLFVAFQASVFFLGTWLALGIKTGVWGYAYLAGIPILVLHFAAIYSFSALLAVYTRSTVACMLGTLFFWVVCFLMNYARHSAIALPLLAPDSQLPPLTRFIIDAGYWMLPKPADLIMILENAQDAGKHTATLASIPEFAKVRQLNEFHSGLSLLTSFLASIVLFTLAGYQLGKTEY